MLALACLTQAKAQEAPPEQPQTIQERAYTMPIWYMP
jgi:hypothetical protein